jgi:hypothetical protein
MFQFVVVHIYMYINLCLFLPCICLVWTDNDGGTMVSDNLLMKHPSLPHIVVVISTRVLVLRAYNTAHKLTHTTHAHTHHTHSHSSSTYSAVTHEFSALFLESGVFTKPKGSFAHCFIDSRARIRTRRVTRSRVHDITPHL